MTEPGEVLGMLFVAVVLAWCCSDVGPTWDDAGADAAVEDAGAGAVDEWCSCPAPPHAYCVNPETLVSFGEPYCAVGCVYPARVVSCPCALVPGTPVAECEEE